MRKRAESGDLEPRSGASEGSKEAVRWRTGYRGLGLCKESRTGLGPGEKAQERVSLGWAALPLAAIPLRKHGQSSMEPHVPCVGLLPAAGCSLVILLTLSLSCCISGPCLGSHQASSIKHLGRASFQKDCQLQLSGLVKNQDI